MTFYFQAVLLGIGLQNKNIEKISEELNMPVGQILAKFYDCTKRITKYLMAAIEKEYDVTISQVEHELVGKDTQELQSIEEDLADEERVIKEKQRKKLVELKKEFHKYAIKGTNEDLQKSTNKNKVIDINSKVNESKRKNKNKFEGKKKMRLK